MTKDYIETYPEIDQKIELKKIKSLFYKLFGLGEK
jgi:hypothetical protein